MRVSVLIPAYNCALTIRATLESVLGQTLPADEILVMNDGSTDGTALILKEYEPRIRVFEQPKTGVSSARNALIARAHGDLLAFLDSDDVWHSTYLETLSSLFRRYPTAAALFAAHTDFCGLGAHTDWNVTHRDTVVRVEVLEPLNFLQRVHGARGPFVMSFCCVPKRVLDGIGTEPFRLRVAEDIYFFNQLPFWGPVVFASAPPLAAYRVRAGSLASNRLSCAEGEVKAFELTEDRYETTTDDRLVSQFKKAFASRRRSFAQILLGVGRTSDARGQLRRSLSHSSDLVSRAKSLGLLSLSYLPKSLQPKWPSADRDWQPSNEA